MQAETKQVLPTVSKHRRIASIVNAEIERQGGKKVKVAIGFRKYRAAVGRPDRIIKNEQTEKTQFDSSGNCRYRTDPGGLSRHRLQPRGDPPPQQRSRWYVVR